MQCFFHGLAVRIFAGPSPDTVQKEVGFDVEGDDHSKVAYLRRAMETQEPPETCKCLHAHPQPNLICLDPFQAICCF